MLIDENEDSTTGAEEQEVADTPQGTTDTSAEEAQDTGTETSAQGEAQPEEKSEEDQIWEEALSSQEGIDTSPGSKAINKELPEKDKEEPSEDSEEVEEQETSPETPEVDYRALYEKQQAELEQQKKMQRDTKAEYTRLTQKLAEIESKMGKETPAAPSVDADDDEFAKYQESIKDLDETSPEVRMLVKQELKKALQSIAQQQQESRKKTEQMTAEQAYWAGVRERVPDFDKHHQSVEFKDWLHRNPNKAQAILNEFDVNDPEGSAKVVKTYCAEMGIGASPRRQAASAAPAPSQSRDKVKKINRAKALASGSSSNPGGAGSSDPWDEGIAFMQSRTENHFI